MLIIVETRTISYLPLLPLLLPLLVPISHDLVPTDRVASRLTRGCNSEIVDENETETMQLTVLDGDGKDQAWEKKNRDNEKFLSKTNVHSILAGIEDNEDEVLIQPKKSPAIL